MNAASQRPTLTHEQLVRYISLLFQCGLEDGKAQFNSLENSIKTDPLKALTLLQRRHLATVPFSNVVLHYSQHHTISLDPDLLFHKIVERGLGGYCVENTGLFEIVLRSLGYKFYTGGARVASSFNPGNANGSYSGWGHMILIVTIGDNKYLVDVGFGPNGPTSPLLLRDGETGVAISPAQMRLSKETIAANADSGQKPWLFQFRSNSESEWIVAYAFYEIEFLPGDYEIMNFYTSQHPSSPFTQGIICTRFLLNENKDNIIGTLMLLKDTVKQNLNGEIELLETLKSEEERVSALKKLFDIHLQPMDIRGIRGRGLGDNGIQ